MEVQLKPELQAKLEQWAIDTERPATELLEVALETYLDELAELRKTLDTRYDEVVNGEVQLIPGDELRAHFRERRGVRTA